MSSSTRFSSGAGAPLMLSVSGARGIVGESMTPDVAAEFAAAFGSFLRQSTGSAQPLVILARDSRPSGEELLNAAIAGLMQVGCNVADLGIQATPTVGVMIQYRHADGGIVITASHNPAQWNGIKCLNADGVAPPARDAQEVIRRFREKDFEEVARSAPARVERMDGRSARDEHINRILEHVRAEPIRAARLRVALDSVNGAGGPAARTLLDSLGVDVIHLGAEPDGNFAHPPEPLAENLRELAAAVVEHDAHLGFAQDPDADRLAIVDENGRYIGEEYTLVLCALRVLEALLPTPHSGGGRGAGGEGASSEGRKLNTPWFLAANLSTSRMIDDLAARFPNVEVLRSAVGEANVVDVMKPYGRRAVIGGEGNGGVIYPPVCWVRDSLSSMALVLALLADRLLPPSPSGRRAGGEGASLPLPPVEDSPWKGEGGGEGASSLSSIINTLPRFAMIKQKFDLSSLGGRDAVDGILSRVRELFENDSSARINDADGVRVDVADGWVHLRPSNTEPIIRLIAEARTPEAAEDLIARVAHVAGLG